jgi:hypothetical protein
MEIDISAKSTYSLERIEEFNTHLSTSKELQRQTDYCIYTTGSYGRLEASIYSDLDLFFLIDDKTKFSKISKTLIDADIIRACREMHLPEFSGDGEYLEVHSINDIYSELGSREDDYNNYFTARMLLLLESKAIYNINMYDKMLETTVDRYYKDFHEHETNFQPVFIVNDVIRFWRTMCLNYEHNRNRKVLDTNTEEENASHKVDSHIKNLKLRFSRKLTCYSFLLSILCSDKLVLTQNDILAIIKLTPLQRLYHLLSNTQIRSKVQELISLYFWFLEITQIEKSELKKWIAVGKNRNEAFNKSRDFSKIMFDLMIENDKRDILMYFLG